MNFLIGANILETLNIDWTNILVYLAAFVVLFVGLTFLLYKPVKKFMDKRRQDIAEEIAQAEKIKDEAEAKVREEQEKAALLTEEVKSRVAELEEEKIVAQSAREALLAQARSDAEKIKADAQREANEERQKAVQSAKNDVADLAVNVAKAILEREITAKDDEKLIDECIKDMKND